MALHNQAIASSARYYYGIRKKSCQRGAKAIRLRVPTSLSTDSRRPFELLKPFCARYVVLRSRET